MRPSVAPFSPLDRRRFLGFSAGALATAVAGCRQFPRADARGSTVIVAYPREKNMDPENDEVPKFLVFLPLLTENGEGELEGSLAERWEHSPDYHEWTFHLRRGVRWHDGTPVTAHDVKFTIKLLTDVLEFGPGAIESVTVLDDSAVTIRYSTAYTTSTLTWEVCYPKHLLEHLDPKHVTEWDFWKHPVGNGPYRFLRYVPQTLTEFAANADYFRGKPRIDRVILKYSGKAGLTELLSGDVDVVLDAAPAQVPGLAADPRFRAYHGFTGIGSATYTIFWQNAHPFFRDPRVRLALTLAINRRELIQLLNLPESVPVVDGPYTRRQLRRGGLPEPLPYDPQQAAALLDAAGYRALDGDGVRGREGTPFRFALLVWPGWPWSEIAVYLREQFRRVGVFMDIRTVDRRLVNREVAQGRFEAVLGVTSWTANLQSLLGGSNKIGYHNAAVTTLLTQLPLAMDPAEEDRLRSDLAQVLRAEVPATFLFPRVETVFAHRRIRGLSTPWRADPLRLMGDLWIDDRGEG